MALRKLILNCNEVQIILRWFEEYQATVASSPLGGSPMDVENQIAHALREALQAKREFSLSELDTGWVQEWAERSVNPTRMGNRALLEAEKTLLDRLAIFGE